MALCCCCACHIRAFAATHPLSHTSSLAIHGSLDSGAIYSQAWSLADLLRLHDNTLAYLLGLHDRTWAYLGLHDSTWAYLGLHDSTRSVCIAGQLEAAGSTSKGSWVSSPKQSVRAEDRRAEGRRASTGSSAPLTRSGSVKCKLHSRQPPHVQVHEVCVCVCVCVCVALYVVNQTLAAQTSGQVIQARHAVLASSTDK